MYLLSLSPLNNLIALACSIAIGGWAAYWVHKKTFDWLSGLFPVQLFFIGSLLSLALSVTTFVFVLCVVFWIFDGGLYSLL